tara:strand:- start:620 stop:865 length:246 start_codon:yes stop_codon:yes gene_type:complete
MKHHEYISDMDTDKIEIPDTKDFTWHIKDLKSYILGKVSDLTTDNKGDKIVLSRLYETLTGETVIKDNSKGEDFVIIKKET